MRWNEISLPFLNITKPPFINPAGQKTHISFNCKKGNPNIEIFSQWKAR